MMEAHENALPDVVLLVDTVSFRVLDAVSAGATFMGYSRSHFCSMSLTGLFGSAGAQV